MQEKIFTIGQVAKETGIGIETIRYYERMRLMPQPKRSPSGYRQYCPNCVQRLNFIKNAKALGFSLKEISELFALRVRSKTRCGDIKNKAEAKIADIEERIKTLQRMKNALKKLSSECRGKGPVGECPILENFDS
ncbi:MAG: heavy metal-responsive transcriptional regulator [Candidatus Omnitrophica bacterium]|nr:heavy metal-responsive transcriptional regulator [Candidatus Omnitrophota bacterium]